MPVPGLWLMISRNLFRKMHGMSGSLKGPSSSLRSVQLPLLHQPAHGCIVLPSQSNPSLWVAKKLCLGCHGLDILCFHDFARCCALDGRGFGRHRRKPSICSVAAVARTASWQNCRAQPVRCRYVSTLLPFDISSATPPG